MITANDKPLYDRLLSREAAAVRQHLRAAPAYQNRLVRFLENHDELRAAHEFPVPVHEAAAVLTYLIPSLRFFHEGQLEGRQVKVPIPLGRRPEEPVDPLLQEFYRKLLACLKRPEVCQGRWATPGGAAGLGGQSHLGALTGLCLGREGLADTPHHCELWPHPGPGLRGPALS